MFVRATGRQIVGDLRYPKYQLQQILDSLTQTRNKDMNILKICQDVNQLFVCKN